MLLELNICDLITFVILSTNPIKNVLERNYLWQRVELQSILGLFIDQQFSLNMIYDHDRNEIKSRVSYKTSF